MNGRNWERGPAVSFPGIHKSDFRYSVDEVNQCDEWMGVVSLDISDCRRDGRAQAAAAMVGSRSLSPQKDGRTGDALPLPNV
jgi:hypothetical protein